MEIRILKNKQQNKSIDTYNGWHERRFHLPEQQIVPDNVPEEGLPLDVLGVPLRRTEPPFGILAE